MLETKTPAEAGVPFASHWIYTRRRWRSSKITDIPQPASLDSIVVTSKLSGMLNQSKTAKTYVSSKLIDTLPTEAPA